MYGFKAPRCRTNLSCGMDKKNGFETISKKNNHFQTTEMIKNIRNEYLNSGIPTWLKMLNISILLPIIIWPLLFMHAGEMLDSQIEYVWIKFLLMLFYPAILIGNIFFSKKLYNQGYGKLAVMISIFLGLCGGWFVCDIFC